MRAFSLAFFSIVTACGTLAFCPRMSNATNVTNGSFEAGMSGWTQAISGVAQASVVSSNRGFLPSSGSEFAVFDATSHKPDSTTGGPVGELTVTQSFFANAGDRIYCDFAGGRSFNSWSYAKVDDLGLFLNGGTALGWQTASCQLPTSGNHTLLFDVMARSDPGGDGYCFLLIDNVRVTPEPSTLAMLVGVLSLLGYSWRRKLAS
jgi:hypothetical protein